MYDLWFLSQPDGIEAWKHFKEKYPHARQKIVEENFEKVLYECAKESFTQLFWTVSDFICLTPTWSFDLKVNEYDSQYIHTWPNNKNLFWDYDSVTLWPKSLVLQHPDDIDQMLNYNVKFHEENILEKYDVFFISYEEESADENWAIFKERVPRAKRVDKVKGIHNAHKRCAMLSETEMFYTVDADSIILDNWDFSFIPPAYDRNYLHLWYSRNPINNLEYGYGAVKLWPRHKVLEFDRPWIDFTTSVSEIKIIDTVISVTKFNTSEYSTWKSAFRECVKLHDNISKNKNDNESILRLKVWLTEFNNVPFGEWASKGAFDATEWVNATSNIEEVNDFDWLKKYFIKRHPDQLKMYLTLVNNKKK